jgi:hypothetical protein
MERHHYSFMNRDYHPDIVRGWQTEGGLPELERRLGYRLVLLDAELPERVRPGGSFRFRARLRNERFAAPFNPRPVELVLRDAAGRHAVTLAADVRALLPGEHTLEARVRVPALLPGAYTLALRLPSAAPALADRPAFSIRLANEGTWRAATGDNDLGAITLDPAAPGTADPGATALTVLDRPLLPRAPGSRPRRTRPSGAHRALRSRRPPSSPSARGLRGCRGRRARRTSVARRSGGALHPGRASPEGFSQW